MEFANIEVAKFDINKPPKAYPTSTPSRDGNYSNDDKDFSKQGTFTPEELDDIHGRSDLDTSRKAQHHTLGPGRNQSSPGDHIHDGTTSKKIGAGLGLTITGSRGGNAAVASIIAMLKTVIEFTDSTTP